MFEGDSQDLQNDRILALEGKIKALETATEGIKSIYEGQAANINDLNNKFNAIERANANNESLTALQEQVANNTKNIQTLKDSLSAISESIAQIKNLLGEIKQNEIAQNEVKQSEVKQSEVKQNKSKQNEAKQGESEDKNEQKESPAIEFEKDKTRRGEIFKEARKLLNTGKFDEAIARYNWFIEIKYKSAESYYMLGRMAYAMNKYDDAISYFKESATLDENASYMPRLMLNCANSLRVLDRAEDAKAFYESLIKRFPTSSEAKEAKKELQKIK